MYVAVSRRLQLIRGRGAAAVAPDGPIPPRRLSAGGIPRAVGAASKQASQQPKQGRHPPLSRLASLPSADRSRIPTRRVRIVIVCG